MEINWDEKFKVRCSAISKVMSNSKSSQTLTDTQATRLIELSEKLQKNGSLTIKQSDELCALREKEKNGREFTPSETCREYMMEEYSWITEGMIPVGKESLDLIAARKGEMVEQDGMRLLSEVDGVEYKRYVDEYGEKQRIYSSFLSGEIDFYSGEHVMAAGSIVDNKAKFDYPTFLKCIKKTAESSYYQQVQGYMNITGAKKGFISNTLVSAPDEIIEDMRWALARKLRCATTESPEFLTEWPKWLHSMKFDHMPAGLRVHKIPVKPFTNDELNKLHDRIKECRQWLYRFHEERQQMNVNYKIYNDEGDMYSPNRSSGDTH